MKSGSAGCPEPHDRAEEGDPYRRLIAQRGWPLRGRGGHLTVVCNLQAVDKKGGNRDLKSGQEVAKMFFVLK